MSLTVQKFLKIILAILILFIPFHLNAQVQFKGKVVDSITKSPLPGANLQILGTLYGASTDVDGNFQIPRLPPGNYAIQVSMIGYRNQVQKDVFVGNNQSAEITFELQETPIQFDPIVITAGKTKQRLDQVPVSLSIVSAEEIKRRNPTNLIGALETTSGVHFIGDQINIRGSTGYAFGAGNKVLLLLDGVPIQASDTGEINWDALPPLDIEQIEVLKGAGSSLWGASALGGVVNIITKSPQPEAKFLFSVNAGKYDKSYYQEWNWTNPNRLHFFRTDLSYSKQFHRFGAQISAGRFTSTGYTQLGDFTKYNLTTKLEYRFANDIKWTGYAAYSNIHRGFFVQWKGQNDPYQVDETNLNNYAHTNQLNLYSKLAIPFSARFGINIRTSLVRTLMGNQFGDGGDFNPAFGQGLELQADWIPFFNHLVTLGVQYQHDAGSTKFFGKHKGYFVGQFLQDEWKVRENLRLTAGFRYDRYQLIQGPKEDLFCPRIGLNWQPWSTTSFRASTGSGFRAATIVERFLELSIMNFKIKANPELKAEKSWAYEIGCRQYLTSNWNIDVALFRNDYRNLIEPHLDLIRGQIQFRNIFNARIEGVEATTNLNFPFQIFRWKINSNWQASITAIDHKDLKWNEPLTYRPKLLAMMKSSFQISKAAFQMDYRYASRIDEVKIYPINDRVPMKFLDIRLSYEVRSLTFQIGVNNLLQYNYAPMESNLMPMRTFVVSVRGEF
jgi:outer membrane receptor for ferrienterochelin and colicins